MRTNYDIDLVRLQRQVRSKGFSRAVSVRRPFPLPVNAGLDLDFESGCRAIGGYEELSEFVAQAAHVDELMRLCEQADILEV